MILCHLDNCWNILFSIYIFMVFQINMLFSWFNMKICVISDLFKEYTYYHITLNSLGLLVYRKTILGEMLNSVYQRDNRSHVIKYTRVPFYILIFTFLLRTSIIQLVYSNKCSKQNKFTLWNIKPLLHYL